MTITPIKYDTNDKPVNINSLKVFSKQEYQNFDGNKILKSLLNETKITREDAEIIVNEVKERLILSRIKTVTPRMIREMTLSILIEYGLIQEYKDYTNIGIPSFDIQNLIVNGDRENSNITHNPQAIHGKISDIIFKEYALKRVLVPEVAKAHIDCKIHVHDLQFYTLGMFCQAHDPRLILKFGLPPTKSLRGYKYSRPTSKIRTTCLHLANWFSYTQSVFSGGQGYLGFNTMLAPFAHEVNDYELKNSLESFIFQVNQQRDSRGHQIPFTSIDLNLGIDPTFKNLHTVMKGVTSSHTYDEYEDDAIRIVEKLAEIFKSGDANGVPFSFPKFELKVSTEKIKQHEKTWDKIVDLIATNGSPYIMNGNLLPESAQCQCCRIIFNPDNTISKYCVEPKKFIPTDEYFPSFGAQQPVSINLPRIAIEAKMKIDECFTLLEERLELALKCFKQKEEITRTNMERGFPEFYCIKINEKPMIDLDLQSFIVGHVGLNEMIENLIGKDLSTDEGHALGKKFLEYMADWCQKTSIKTKMMINLWEQPAESTANTFALYDVKKFGTGIRHQGSGNSVYYTNSNHIPYSYDVPLHRIIKLQGEYHPIIKGGVITHIWLGEEWIDQTALKNMINKILTNTKTYYFCFTKDFTICNDCGKCIPGRLKKCFNCSSENLDYLSRITGYYSLTSNYNDGKKQEFEDRRRNSISENI